MYIRVMSLIINPHVVFIPLTAECEGPQSEDHQNRKSEEAAFKISVWILL